MRPHDAGLPSLVLAGSAWFWGARLAAGALLALGGGPTAAQALAWMGVAGAGWVLAPWAVAARWGHIVGAALLVASPEAVAAMAERLTRAAVLGLRAPLPSVALDGVGQALLVAAPLAASAIAVGAVPRALTSARRRFPT